MQAGLWGLGNLLVNVSPIFLMCDPRDIRAVTEVRSPFTGQPTIYLYESVPGGVGMAEQLFRMHAELLKAARDLAAGCGCTAGCPSCVGPFSEIGGNPKRAALTILQTLLAARPVEPAPETGARP
jgi:DEAD/DEAH box helicase domain-containing protein